MCLLVEGMIIKLLYGIYRGQHLLEEAIPEPSENRLWHTPLNLRLIICMLTKDEADDRTWGLSASGGSAEMVGIAFGKTFQAVSIVL
jgi:hypothetical protein